MMLQNGQHNLKRFLHMLQDLSACDIILGHNTIKGYSYTIKHPAVLYLMTVCCPGKVSKINSLTCKKRNGGVSLSNFQSLNEITILKPVIFDILNQYNTTFSDYRK